MLGAVNPAEQSSREEIAAAPIVQELPLQVGGSVSERVSKERVTNRPQQQTGTAVHFPDHLRGLCRPVAESGHSGCLFRSEHERKELSE